MFLTVKIPVYIIHWIDENRGENSRLKFITNILVTICKTGEFKLNK